MKAPVNAMSLRRIANLMVYLFERRRQYGQPSDIRARKSGAGPPQRSKRWPKRMKPGQSAAW